MKGISQAFLFKAKPYTMRNIASLKWSHSERPTSFTSILLALNRTSVFTVLSYGGGQPCEVSTLLTKSTRLQMNINLAVRGEVEIKRDVAANELGRSFRPKSLPKTSMFSEANGMRGGHDYYL